MPNQLKAFISYSHEDEPYKDQLLKSLKLIPNISHWDDRQIVPGQDWDLKIKEAFQESHIILLLISPDFLDSNYIIENELKFALEKHDSKKACVIPIFIRPCMLTYKPEIDRLQGLPKEKKYVSKWDDKDSAYLEIAMGIDQAIKELTKDNNSLFSDKISEIKDDIMKDSIEELKNKKKIYLSLTSNDKKSISKRTSTFGAFDSKSKYEEWPYIIVPDPNEAEKISTMSLEEQKEIIKNYMDECIFSIHLINSEDENQSDIIHLQYDLAKRKCSSSLFNCIVATNDLNQDDDLYKKIEEGSSTYPNIIKLSDWSYDSIWGTLESLITENEKKIEDLENKLDPNKSVFLFYGAGDKENQLKEKLKEKLEKQYKYYVRESILDYDEVGFNPKQWEENQLKKCEGAIILYGCAAKGWFTIRKHIVMDDEKIKWKAVCIDEPNKDMKYNSLMVEPGLNLINNISELEKAMTNG